MTGKEIFIVIVAIYAVCFVAAFLTTRAVNIQNQTNINLTDVFLVLCPVFNFFVILFNIADMSQKSNILNKLFFINWDKHS